MSEVILSNDKGNTREACLAVLIVGALIHEGLIVLPRNQSPEYIQLSIRLVARLLQGNLVEDQPSFPVDY